MFSTEGYGQTGEADGLFLLAYNKSDLEPITQTKNGEYLHLEFSKTDLTQLFEQKNVLSYENAFSGLNKCDEELDRVFAVHFENPVQIKTFKNNPHIKIAEIIPHLTLAVDDTKTPVALGSVINHEDGDDTCLDVYPIPWGVELPDDYNIPSFHKFNSAKYGPEQDFPCDSIPNDYLSLIHAPCAWSLTHGDPNVLVGVSDSYFSEAHEELTGKFDTIIGNSAYLTDYQHGIVVSALLAGNTDNGKGTASIGYNTRLVGSVLEDQNLYKSVKKLVLWSEEHEKKLRIINMSWTYPWSLGPDYPAPDTILKKFYRCIRNQYDIVLVAASGNDFHKPSHTNYIPYAYPASFESVISVTAVGSRYPISYELNDSLVQDMARYGVNHWPMTINDSVDIAAPGYDLYRISNTGGANPTTNTYKYIGHGTSQAAPIVSGTAALMLSVNPDLTAKEVKQILKTTAYRIDTLGINDPSFEGKLGAGRLDAYKAVKMAKYFNQYGFDYDAMPKHVDLMIQDSPEDHGEEPNEKSDHFWESEDIWVRNQPDGIEEHENPQFDPLSQSYVYVKIRNRGCDPSSPEDKLMLHWAQAGTSLAWPYNWVGNHFPDNGPLLGDTIGSVSLPSIKPGEVATVKIPWSVPNPQNYKNINQTDNPWHFCLLARVISEDDPISPPPAGNTFLPQYVKANNNIAWKNVTVLGFSFPVETDQPTGGVIAIGNPLTNQRGYNLQLSAKDEETGKKIFDEAEVSITLDDHLLEAWERGGEKSSNLFRKGNVFIAENDNAILENFVFNPYEIGTASVNFNFLTKEITNKENYTYYAVQKLTSDGTVIGGETFKIKKEPRTLFYANTFGNQTVDKGEDVILNAEPINEPASYNWYDSQGELVYQGADFNTAVQIGKLYQLEVIALSDGYKDYTAVQVKYKPNRIKSISPNPGNNQTEVDYKINTGDTAYLSVVGIENPNISNNYVIDLDQESINLTLGELPSGIYAVTLVVDGQIADYKNLIKN